jgi:hypothetical protein
MACTFACWESYQEVSLACKGDKRSSLSLGTCSTQKKVLQCSCLIVLEVTRGFAKSLFNINFKLDRFA